MEELKRFCKEHMISWIPRDGAIVCVKICPDSISKDTCFFSMTIKSLEEWSISVWKDNPESKRRKLKMYLESNCDIAAIQAIEFGFNVFKKEGGK